MGIFSLKLKLSNSPLADELMKVRAFSSVDQKIMERIEGFSYDAAQASKLRERHAQDLARLQQGVPALSVDAPRTLKELEEYRSLLNRQFRDVDAMLDLSRRLEEDEYLELLYDLRNPLVLFEECAAALKNALEKADIDPAEAIVFANVFGNMESQYKRLFHSLFDLIDSKWRGNGDSHAISRSQQQVEEAWREVNAALESLLRLLKAAGKSQVINDLQQASSLLSQKFDQLVKFCIARIDVAGAVLQECSRHQHAMLDELQQLNVQIDAFCSTILAQQGEVVEPRWKTQETVKHIKGLRTQQSHILGAIQEMKMESSSRVERLTERFKEEKRRETEELQALGSTLQSTRKKLTKLAASILLVLALGAGTKVTVSDRENVQMIEKRVSQEGCAEWVINFMSRDNKYLKALMTNVFGVSGNAWTMQGNLRSRGGTVVYNAFDGIYASKGERIASLREKMAGELDGLKGEGEEEAYLRLNARYAKRIRAFFPKKSKADVGQLKVGDVVGLYYTKSDNQARAFLQARGDPATFNSHVGVVTSAEDGVVLVTHNIHGRLEVSEADDLLRPRNKDNSMIVWVVRPLAMAKVVPLQSNL